MPSFLLALMFLFYFYKNSFVFVQASSISGDIVPYTAPLERRGDLDSSTDPWLLQMPKGGDLSLFPGAAINQEDVAAVTAPNTNSNNFLSSPPNIINVNNDKLLLSDVTTSETGLLLASNTDCRSSSANIDSTTLESNRRQQPQMAAGQPSLPTEKRNIRGRMRRRRRRRGENSVVVEVPPKDACPAPPLPLSLPPSTQQPQNAQNALPPQKNRKKKTTTAPKANPQPSPPSQAPQTSPPPPPSSADLNWNEEMYPSLFRIPTDGYTEGGYNPTCITKTDGLLPLGVCDSGDNEDVQGSARDFYGNPIDAAVFLDAVAFKLERCRLGMCIRAKEKRRRRRRKKFFLVLSEICDWLIEFHCGPFVFFCFFCIPLPLPRRKEFSKKDNSSCTVILYVFEEAIQPPSFSYVPIYTPGYYLHFPTLKTICSNLFFVLPR